MKNRLFVMVGVATWSAFIGIASADGTRARPHLFKVPEIGAERIRTQLAPVVTSGTPIAGVVQGPQFFPQSVASGDPRPDSVVLWTRVADPDAAGQDVPVRVIVTQDQFFAHVVTNQVFMARAAYDNCLKIRLTGLAPRTTYYYFFVFYKNGVIYLSRLGRTKTAPASTDTAPVRFAYFSCQDYEGRFYNTYAKLLLDHADDLDFVAFIGDYIYETAGDPSSQTPIPGRAIDFADKAGAIQLGSSAQPFWAASSLANYRQLYQTYRSDAMLQKLHESFPMVATWDDHEYSNDCHGAVATYFDKRKDENDPTRRRHAEQAFFEYMPISAGLGPDGTLAIDDSILYPNAMIYQDFKFGANLDLMLTDYRSYRSDVLIPENAFPGAVVLDKATIQAILGTAGYAAIQGSLDPYVDISSSPVLQPIAARVLKQLYLAANPFLDDHSAATAASQAANGNVSATYLNALFVGAGLPAAFSDADLASLDRGLPYLLFGKLNLYDSQGSRYVVAKDSFDLLSAYLWAATQGAAEDVYGATQEAWIKDTLSHSTAAWKVFASSVSMTPMVMDFLNPEISPLLPQGFPDAYRTRLMVDAEQWDGFPQRRAELISFLQGIPGSAIISGDIHASFVTDHGAGLYEFTGAAVSSQTLVQEVGAIVQASSTLSQVPGIDQLVAEIGQILQVSSLDPSVSSAPIGDVWPDSHGCVVMTASPTSLTATYYHIDSSQVGTSYYSDTASLNALFTTTTFTVQGGALQPVSP